MIERTTKTRMSVIRAEVLTRLATRPMSYTALRGAQILALGVNALVLALLLGVHQYALYARGAFFATPFSAISFLGQDQLLFRRKIDARTLMRRLALIQVVVGIGVLALAAATTNWSVLPTVISSCIGTAGMGVMAVRLLSAQLEGRDDLRAVGQLLNAVTVQSAAIVAALLGAGAFVATTAATVVSLLWVVAIRDRHSKRARVRPAAPFRSGVAVGIGTTAYGSITATIALVVAIRAPDVIAARDRFVLLAFSALLGVAASLNAEYFRVRLFDPQAARERKDVERAMLRANVSIAGAVALGVVVSAYFARVVLPARYGDVGRPIAELAVVVPLLFGSSMLFNIELARNRVAIAVTRNLFAGVFCLIAALLVSPVPSNIVAILTISEASGFAILGGSSLYLRLNRGAYRSRR